MTNQELKAAIRDKFAWPGGYAFFGVCDDGGILCCNCMRAEFRQIIWARKHELKTGWRVAGVDHTGNCDEPETCDHCNNPIE